ncbi:MAG: hypothetical protein JNM86_00135 [Phycisphaerae bacterium]|nr:hypothetical protein [Phycisphaerae bacterium]
MDYPKPERMPHAPTTLSASPASNWRGKWLWLGFALLLLALIGAIASIGGPLTGLQAPAAAAYWIVRSGWPAALFIASAIGLGSLALPLFREAKERWAIQAAVGISIQLTVGHAINWAGAWLPGIAWNIASLAPGLLGLVLLVISIRKAPETATARSGRGIWMIAAGACTLALAVMLVAASEAPGVLWASEFGGFDVLSYHLQLPREWLEMGRLAPLNHNVYSYLPSYFESAFLTLQLRTFAPRTTPDGVSGMLVDDGWRALACQMLHVDLGIVAAWMVAAATRELLERSRNAGDSPTASESDVLVVRTGGWLGAAAFLCVPWVVVVGSMAYNELALCALFAGAMLVAADRGMTGTCRGVLVGWLVGVACGVKPTALILCAPASGLALIWFSPMRNWARMTLVTVLAGFVALLPWLIRNWMASGNPVFPYAHGLFGDAHWSAEQYKRFAGAHHFDGSWADRFKLLFLVDPNDPAGPRHRGLMHPQWSGFFPMVGAAALIGLAARATHRCAALLAAALIMQIAAWLVFTHLQSRFLLPLAVPGAMLIGLIGSGAWLNVASIRWDLYRKLTMTAAALCAGFMAMRSLDAFWSEVGGNPNQTLALGPGALSQERLRTGDSARVRPGEVLYLLGDSTPFYFPGPLVYHTTWDTSPLGEAVRSVNDSEQAPFEWSSKLIDRGIGAVLINFSELGRLIESKWYDPAITRDVFMRWSAATKPALTSKSTTDELAPVVRPLRAPEAKP